jgi:hypothetical protein
VSEPKSGVDPRDLDLLRTEHAPDPAARGRVRSRLAAVLPMGGGGSPGGEGPAPKPPSRALRGTGATGSPASYGIAAVAFLTGGVVGAVLYAGLTKPPPPQVVYVDRPVVVPASSGGLPSAESSPVPETSPPEVTSSPSRSSPSRSHASHLSAERVILDEARAAISQGDAQRGLDRLERHRRLFPTALLAEERDALQVQALVKAARYNDARARADSFRNRTPGSLFLPMVEAAITSIP